MNNGGIEGKNMTSQGSILPALFQKVAGSPTVLLIPFCGGNRLGCSFSIRLDLKDEEATYQPKHRGQWKSL